nr:DUF1887 family CARF protein [Moraxella osloensis]
MKTLFVTATAQTLANYHTIWHLANHKTDIDHIVIISTEFSRKKNFVKHLTDLLQNNQQFQYSFVIQELFLPNGIEENDVFAIKSCIQDWLQHNKPKSVIFNVTGGTKLISIAQDQIAQEYPNNIECLYQNMQGEIVWYARNNPDLRVFKIDRPSEIEIYMNAYGYQKVAKQTNLNKLPARQLEYALKILSYLQNDFDKASRFISFLNACCASHTMNDYPYTVKIEPRHLKFYQNWLIDLSQLSEPFMVYDDQTQQLTLDNEDDLRFIMGNWFEVLTGYQYLMAHLQKGMKLEIHASVDYTFNESPNEIDIAFVKDGYFHYVECKTVKWKDDTKTVNRNVSHLDSTGEVAGLGSKKTLVSLYPLPYKAKINAQNKDIYIVEGKQILDLNQYLTD